MAERPPGAPPPGSSDRALVRSAARLRGELRMPGDKSVSHRALILAAMADGESLISGAGDGGDVRSTAEIVRRLGCRVDRLREDGRTVDYRVRSPGMDRLSEPDGVLDCQNSGTSLRLFAGLLAGQPFFAVLDGDDSLRRRPLTRIIEPLRSMGASLHARHRDSLPPLAVIGRYPLTAIEMATAIPSAQVKSAILLAGLRADGRTIVREAVATRDHTERMLRARGVPVRAEKPDGRDGAFWISIEGGGRVAAMPEQVPGDCSAAAFWLVAAAVHPDAEVTIRGVGVNPTRRLVVDLLGRMGASIIESGHGADNGIGEPVADLTASSSRLVGIDISPAEVAGAIDEIPILCLAASQARGSTTIRGAGELRHKESDRLAGIVTGLKALGAEIAVEGDTLSIRGPRALRGASTESLGDHRLAMTFAVAGLLASGETIVEAASSAAVSYPGFFTDLERMRT